MKNYLVENSAIKWFTIVYTIILIGDLVGIALDIPALIYIFKPLLMLALGFHTYFFIKTTPPQLTDQYLLAALFFSWLGDILLMNSAWFIGGLGAFLVAHICYIRVFKNDNTIFVFSQRDRKLWAGVILLFTASLMIYLFNYLGALKIPVLIYATVITIMLLTVLNRWRQVPPLSFQVVMLGAALFAISDSMIAINKFAQPVVGAPILIMVTYAIGQYCIVQGYALRKKA